MKILLLLLISCLSVQLTSQDLPDKREYQTQRLLEGEISVDRIATDEVWNLVEWQSDFTVHNPNNGEKPTRQTRFKVLYDDDFLYLAFYCEY